ncbi:protein adenylyltransferase SelO [Pseudonocardia acidicola]|uniref:Protein nucleotidyltransferase YdiU n=1 Tax=Pseudonocardia acidicola TaxID=2724939 RepID=A0ABX1SLM8_9PSEU|nr:YdiU family protein [Pseudonocardia acidicola]NMI01971.1 YdiU family protein [Pseudonocardia acidicola]
MTVAARVLFEFDDSYARALPGLCVPWTAAPVPAPELLVLNEQLAAELGADPRALREPAGVALLVGSGVPDGVSPVAQAYAGHQFGGYVPRLGDGRALLIGELIDCRGQRRDLHLKGSGRTPFARGGDGKAAVGPMLREYVMGEAMHALGIPTTRALAVVATGEEVFREATLPGAVLARVAASHLRVGTFQYAAASGDPALVQKLADYAIARHHPEAAGVQDPYLEFFRRVVDAQAALVARWMLVGFVHGVMNTDNMTISGETIDYGPCAFMDAFSPATVFSSIDHGGRYAYGNQPRIAQWNLARLGETLLPLIDESTDAAVEAATDVLNSFAERYDRYAADGMAAKLGLGAADGRLTQDLLELLNAQQVDFTLFFRALSPHLRGRPEPVRSLFAEPEAFDAWAARWQTLLPPDRTAVAASMDRINPAYVPRNHRVEEALTAATDGDTAPFERLVEVLARPFVERPGLESYREPAATGSAPYVTYCGT